MAEAYISMGTEQILEQAKARGLLVPLTGYKVYVIEASTAGLSAQEWLALKRFWLETISTLLARNLFPIRQKVMSAGNGTIYAAQLPTTVTVLLKLLTT